MTEGELFSKIQQDYQNSAKSEYSGESLAGLINITNQQFSRSFIFFQEFMQNAEDANSTELEFRFYEDEIHISNNGDHFSEENVKSICKIGRSDKLHRYDKIGQFGIGFKSIFMISKEVEIHSAKYHFKFSQNAFEKDSIFYGGTWMLYPIPLTCQNSCKYSSGTTFIVYTAYNTQELLESFSKEYTKYVNERTLLFLNSLERFSIISRMVDFEFICEGKVELGSHDPRFRIIAFSPPLKAKEGRPITTYFLMSNHYAQIAEINDYDEMNLFSNQYVKRRPNNQVPITLAFQLNSYDKMPEHAKGNIQLPLYSYLPFKEFDQYYLPFHICSDFVITPNREKIIDDHPVNRNIIHALIKLLDEKIFPEFISHPQYRYRWFKMMYLHTRGLLEPLGNFLKETIEQGKIYPIEDSVEVGSKADMIDINRFYDSERQDYSFGLTLEDFQNIFPDKRILDHRISFNYTHEENEEITQKVRSYLLSTPSRVQTLIFNEISDIQAKNHNARYERSKIQNRLEWIVTTQEEKREMIIPDRETDIHKFFEKADESGSITLPKALRSPEIVEKIREYFKYIPQRKLKDFSTDSQRIQVMLELWGGYTEEEKLEGLIHLLRDLNDHNTKFPDNNLIYVEDKNRVKQWVGIKQHIVYHHDFKKQLGNEHITHRFQSFYREKYGEEVYVLSLKYKKYISYNDYNALERVLGIDKVFQRVSEHKNPITGYFAEFLVNEFLEQQPNIKIIERYCSKGFDFIVVEDDLEKVIEVKANVGNYDRVSASWTRNETSEIMSRVHDVQKARSYDIYWITNVYKSPIIHKFHLSNYMDLEEFNQEISTTLEKLKQHIGWSAHQLQESIWVKEELLQDESI